jgi:hypothetical protein
MKKKILAREILFLFRSVISILIISGIWYIISSNITNSDKPKTQSTVSSEEKGFREKIYYRVNSFLAKDSFQKVMEIKHKPTFLKLITDTIKNKRIYEISKNLDVYVINDKRYSPDQLKSKYGDKMDKAIEHFGFRREFFLPDLSYDEFNNKIQSDTLEKKDENVSTVKNSENSIHLSDRDYFDDIQNIAIFIFIIVFPVRYSAYVIQWSIKVSKN